ncbi:MAG: Ig-like domain-containing protein [Chlorobium sp.]|nr:Ig-like domain-containing protein [Chlorobium sp.]
MKRPTSILNAILVLLALAASGCASDAPPSGGPTDPQPREVLFSDPDSGSVNTSPSKIRLLFSHPVTARQLLYAIHFSPEVDNYHVTVNGNEGEIVFFNRFEANRTYILTLNKSLLGNYTLPFATGAKLDTSSISGSVQNADLSPAASAFVMAFQNPGTNGSTPDMRNDRPDYLAQTDASGSFHFSHLAPGSYSLMAFDDSNANMRWNRSTEAIGLSCYRAVPVGSKNIALRLTGPDADHPGIAACRPLERQLLELTYTEPVEPADIDIKEILIHHAKTHKPVPVLDWYSPVPASASTKIRVLCGPLKTGEPYIITDRKAGTNKVLFYPTRFTAEKLPISISMTPADKSSPGYMNTVWPELGNTAVISFSRPVTKNAIRSAAVLSESGRRTPETLEYALKQIDARTFSMQPTAGFRPGAAYTLSIDSAAVNGNPPEESVRTTRISRFTAADTSNTGGISGTCWSPRGPVIVEARASKGALPHRVPGVQKGRNSFSYAMTGLAPGSYTISAFVAEDGNEQELYRQKWRPGTLTPLTPSAPFGLHPGNVRVRAQWMAESIDIDIMNTAPGTITPDSLKGGSRIRSLRNQQQPSPQKPEPSVQ